MIRPNIFCGNTWPIKFEIKSDERGNLSLAFSVRHDGGRTAVSKGNEQRGTLRPALLPCSLRSSYGEGGQRKACEMLAGCNDVHSRSCHQKIERPNAVGVCFVLWNPCGAVVVHKNKLCLAALQAIAAALVFWRQWAL